MENTFNNKYDLIKIPKNKKLNLTRTLKQYTHKSIATIPIKKSIHV